MVFFDVFNAIARREHTLAGDDRAGIWARAKARRAQRSYLRSHWRLLILAAALVLAPFLVAVFFASPGFQRRFLVGTGLIAAGSLVAFWVVLVTGTAPLMMGSTAEQWTASELRPLRRGGWLLVNHFILSVGDIDHVLLGPPGAFAIETKWSAEAWNLTKPDERIYRAVSQAEESARDFRLWQPVKQAGVGTVRPLVVLWGSYAASLSEVDSASVNGVPVIAGLSLGRWFQNLNGDSLNPETLEQAWSAIDRHARTRDTADDKRQPVPISVQRLVITSSLTAAGGALGLLAAAKLLSLIGSLYVWVPACLVLMGAAVPIGRWKPARYPALAWQAAVFATLVLAAAVVGVHIVV